MPQPRPGEETRGVNPLIHAAARENITFLALANTSQRWYSNKKVSSLSKGDTVVSSAQDPPIVISGGSVTVEFNVDDFEKVGGYKFRNSNKRIRRVEVVGDGVSPVVIDVPNGKCTVLVHYSND